MFKAISQFWAALFTVFSTLNHASTAAEEIAKLVSEEATGLATTMRIEREAAQAQLIKQLKEAA